MNLPQNETYPEKLNLREDRSMDVPDGFIKNAVPIGTFAGPQDFVVRFHQGGQPAATNSGEQGGGQN